MLAAFRFIKKYLIKASSIFIRFFIGLIVLIISTIALRGLIWIICQSKTIADALLFVLIGIGCIGVLVTLWVIGSFILDKRK